MKRYELHNYSPDLIEEAVRAAQPGDEIVVPSQMAQGLVEARLQDAGKTGVVVTIEDITDELD